MSKKEKLVPELRFPEFEKYGEWEKKALSELGETVNGLSGKIGSDFGHGKPYVTYKQVFDHSVVDFSKCDKVNISKNENQNALQVGDILFTTSSETSNEVGFASVIMAEPEEPTYLNSFCFSLRPFKLDEIRPEFSRYLFRSPIYRKLVSTLAQGSTRYNLSKGAFLGLKLTIPKPEEQQKIASCLSSLDELIAAHSDKLETLEDHKKGLMQNLFPQEGETVPKYRFPEFGNDESWEETELSNYVQVIDGDRGNNYPKAEEYGSVGYCIFLSAKNVTKKGFVFNDVQYITKEKDEALRKGKLTRMDIVLTTRGSLGQFAFYDDNIPFKNIRINSGMVILRAENKTLEPKYFYCYCQSNRINQTIKSQAFGNAVQQLTVAVINNLPVQFPKNKKEQKKIADCFSSLNELITAQAEKLKKLKLHKEGLMQGLFPKIND